MTLVVDLATRRTDVEPATPLVRASRAWLALKASAVLESLAFLGRGVECGRPPRGAACPQHVLGPLIGTVIGPVGGRLRPYAVEELFQRASDVRGLTIGEWQEWRELRFTPQLLEDVTVLAYRGSTPGRSDEVRCTCSDAMSAAAEESDSGAQPMSAVARTRRFDAFPGPVPALIPDPTGLSDPWQDQLVVLASRFRGRGSPLASKYAGSGPSSIKEMRTLVTHLERLAGAFAGPGRADRMAGLDRVEWTPPLVRTRAWRERDRLGSSERAHQDLHDRLLRAVGFAAPRDVVCRTPQDAQRHAR